MDYNKTVSLSGSEEKALEVARNVFIQHGFEIVENSNSKLELRGTYQIWLKGQNPLVGVSRVRVQVAGSNLSVEADFGVIRKTTWCLIFFIVGLAAFMLIVFATVFSLQGQPVRKILLLSLVPFAFWPVVIPLMAKFMKFRTTRALDVLVTNMATVARQRE